jgi:hypothetical protein
VVSRTVRALCRRCRGQNLHSPTSSRQPPPAAPLVSRSHRA